MIKLEFWKEQSRELILALLVFLIATAAFGLGWLTGSKTLTRPPIVINCPSYLYENLQQ